MKTTRSPKHSEDHLALTFTAKHQNEVRFVDSWCGRWMIYRNGVWRPDHKREVWTWARKVCRDAAATESDSQGRRIMQAKTRAAVLSLASDDQRTAATADHWDLDPWILNTPDGTVELRSGTVLPHQPEDYCTKMTAVGPGRRCPTWKEFLRRVTDDDIELIAFLQRAAGYCITGLTRAQALFFLYGLGANGKSVFINTLAGILNDYHQKAPMEVFMASKTDRHPAELAMLQGARLVTAVETEEGRRWAESKIKALTGGDPIAARFMRGDFFQFDPVFKLMICGNHKPSFRSIDEALRRRLHLIPFRVTIPMEERDETLPKRLVEEWPGILGWLIEGACDWSVNGLQPPDNVRAATQDYLSLEDALGIWIEERCNNGANFAATSRDLFKSWRDWCDQSGEHSGTMKRFSQMVEDRGYQRTRIGVNSTRGFRGISPRSDQPMLGD